MGLETEGKGEDVRSSAEVMSAPSWTGRMGANWVAEGSRLCASEKREAEASRMSERERAEVQESEPSAQLMRLLKWDWRVDWVLGVRKP